MFPCHSLSSSVFSNTSQDHSPLHSHQPVTDHKSLHYLQYHLRLRQHITPRSNHFSSARCSISVSFQSLSKPRWQGGNWSHYMWWHILLWITIWGEKYKNILKQKFLWILLLTLILNNINKRFCKETNWVTWWHIYLIL